MNELATTSLNLPSVQEMDMVMKYCEVIAQAPSYATMGGLPGVFALVMTARELGIGPMTALNGGMHLIPNVDKDGKMKGPPQIMMAARTMNMMILRAGHKIEEVENIPGSVTLRGTRADNGVSITVTMTIEMAKAAYLSHDSFGRPKLWSAWFKTMDDMLWKTCISKLARRLFADVIGNAYEPAEFEEKIAAEKAELVAQPKKIKGKNSPVAIEAKQEQKILPAPETTQSLEDFLIEVRLHETNKDENVVEYVKQCASKMKKTWDEMIQYCYENKEGFQRTYYGYAVKQGIIESDSAIEAEQQE